MKKFMIAVAAFFILCFCGITGSAETLEENINNMVGVKQQYNIDLNQQYEKNNQEEVSVDPKNGAVTMRQTDYHLAGINGLDLDITRIYRGDQSYYWNMKMKIVGRAWVDYVESEWDSTDYYSFYEERYNLGVGTRFSFKTIEVRGEHKYLHNDDGAVYRLIGPEEINGEKVYQIEGYQLKDIRVIEDSETNPRYNEEEPIGKSKYIVIDRNGVKTYLSGAGSDSEIKDEGRILGIVDRYGNEIKFEYQDYAYTVDGYTHTRRLISKIIDTVGREVSIEYLQDQTYQLNVGSDGYSDGELNHKFDTKITLPDNSMIVYEKSSFQHHEDTHNSLKERIQWVNILENADDYGKDGEYGTCKYYYWFITRDCKFTYSRGTDYDKFQMGDMGYMYNQWEALNYISYEMTNKQKIFYYTEGRRRFGTVGSQIYEKVSEEIDLVNGSYDIDTETYTGTPERRIGYTYTGEMDGDKISGSTPLINFESESDMTYLQSSKGWYREKEAAKDGEYGICTNPGGNAELAFSVKIDKQGLLSFDAKNAPQEGGKESGDLWVYLGWGDNSGEERFRFEEEWEHCEIWLPQGNYVIRMEYERGNSSTDQIFVDNLRAGDIYYTTTQDLLNPETAQTKYIYNPSNQMIRKEASGADNYQIQEITYDQWGMPSRKQTYSYDMDNGVICDYPQIMTEEFEYDQYGNLLSYVSPDMPDVETSYSYYGADRYFKLYSKETRLKSNRSLLEQISYSVDSMGNTIQEIRKNDQGDAVTDLTYDDKGNILSKTTYSRNDASQKQTEYYEYGAIGDYTDGKLYVTRTYKGDAAAPLEEKTYTYRFDNGLLMSENTFNNTDHQQMTTSYAYDEQYRIERITYADGTYTDYWYYDNGYGQEDNPSIRIITSEDDVAYVYNIYGNLTKKISCENDLRLEENQYDSRQNLLKQTDANGNSICYTYDSAGRLKEKSYWEGDETKKSTVTLDYRDDLESLGYDIVDDVQKVVEGKNFYLLLKKDGTVWSFGDNRYGQLGDGTETDRKYPVQVQGLTDVKDIAAGRDFSMALKEDRTVWTWGDNSSGQLGDGTTTDSSVPVQVKGLSSAHFIEAGSDCAYALAGGGTPWAWGDNSYGILGDGTEEERHTPVKMKRPSSLHNIEYKLSQIFASKYSYNVYAIDTTKGIWGWGEDPFLDGSGILTTGKSFPSSMRLSRQIESYDYSTLAIKGDGVWGWGENRGGLLGADNIYEYVEDPIEINGSKDVEQIAVGNDWVIARKNDNTVLTWGNNGRGCLGRTANRGIISSSPTQIPGLQNIVFVDGGYAAIAVEESGKLWMWGDIEGYQDYCPYPTNIFIHSPSDTARHTVTITDENGYVTTQYYDDANRMVKVRTTPDNSEYYETVYTYDAMGNKIQTKDPKGNLTKVQYDKLQRPIELKGALNDITTYRYNTVDQLIEQAEPGNKVTRYQYDEAGRLILEKTGSADSMNTQYTYKEYQYDRSGNITALSAGHTVAGDTARVLDAQSLYSYNNRNRLAEKKEWLEGDSYAVTQYLYNDTGDLLKETLLADNGYIMTEYEYDPLHRMIRQETKARQNGEDIGVQKTEFAYDNNGNLVRKLDYINVDQYLESEYAYDYQNRMIEIIEPTGQIGENKTTAFVYDPKGNLINKTIEIGNTQLHMSYTYDGLNRLLSETDAMNQTTRYQYDANGNRIKVCDPRYSGQPIESAPGILYEYDKLNRLVKTSFYENGNLEHLESRTYDGRGNVTGIKYGQAEAFSKNEYDADNRLIRVTPAASAAAGITTPAQVMTYDGMGRLLSIRQNQNASASGTVAYEYYGNGLVKSVTYPDSDIKETYVYDKTGKLYEERTDRNGGVTKIFKTLFGTPYRTEYPDGTAETVTYNWYLGLALAYVDRKGRKKEFRYDRRGNLLEQRFCYENTGDIFYWKTEKMTYDGFNNCLSRETYQTTTDAAGNVRTEQSLADRETYEYNNNFAKTRIYNASGMEILYSYDTAGNLITERVNTGSGYDIKRYEYDGIGRLVREILLVNPEMLGSTEYPADGEYPNLKQLITSYTYSGEKPSSVTNPEGAAVTYTYDDDYNLTAVTDSQGNTTAYSYDWAGNIIQETICDGRSISYRYDQMGRVIEQSEYSPSKAVMTWKKTYDLMGNVLSEATPALYEKGQAYHYQYDIMNRLVQKQDADGAVLAQYAYDDADNIVKEVTAAQGAGTQDISQLSGTVYTYDAFDQVTSRTDCYGNKTEYTYDLFGHVTKTIAADGGQTQYTYYPDGTLASAEYPDGGEVSYTYDKKGRMLTETVKQSQTVSATNTYTYTPFDAVYTVTDAQGHTAISFYDGNGNAVKVTDKRGNTTLYTYDGEGRLIKSQIPQSETADGIIYQTETYAYDGAGNLIEKRMDMGDGAERVITYTYDMGYLIQTSNNAGQRTEYVYDDFGNIIETKTLRDAQTSSYDIKRAEYDKYGRLTAEYAVLETDSIQSPGELQDEQGNLLARTEYIYDVSGNLIQTKRPGAFTSGSDAQQYTTQYVYDSLNRLIQEKTKYAGAQGLQDAVTEYTYDAMGNVSSAKDAGGNVTSYTYDTMGRVLSQTNAAQVTTSYGYDLAGNQVSKTTPSGTWTYTYDQLNRLIITRNPEGTAVSENVYDENGNLIKSIDANGYQSGSSSESRYGTVYAYDLANQLISITMPEGGMTQYTYNRAGEPVSVTDPEGGVVSYTYDNAGQLLSVTDPMGHQTLYTYDKAGNRLSMTDANGNTTAYTYAAFNRMTALTDPAGRTVSYRYDISGSPVWMHDRSGNTTIYAYDSQGRVTGQSVTLNGESAVREENSIVYGYDVMGSRVQMTDGSGAYTYEYDSLYRLERVKKDGAEQIAYTYHADNTVASASYGGMTVTYDYDSSQRLTRVRSGENGADYTYDDAGNLILTEQAGGTVQSMAYDKDNRVTEVQIENTDGSTVNESYTYDAAGRRIGKTDGQGTTSYTYDAAGRVTKVVMPGKTAAYEYDAVGNRTLMREEYVSDKTFEDPAAEGKRFDNSMDNVVKYRKTQVSYEYSSENRLTGTVQLMMNGEGKVLIGKTTGYTYDGNGNQYMTWSRILTPEDESGGAGVSIAEEASAGDDYISLTQSTFDGFNRLRTITSTAGANSVITAYTYNGDGLRTEKTVTDAGSGAVSTTRYLYDGQNVVQETGSRTVSYIRGTQYVAAVTDGDCYYYQHNAHGDVVQLTDAAGAVKNRYDYDVFGEPVFQIEEVENSIRYAGEFYDESAGLYYLRARYYNPGTGRFISEDSCRGDSKDPSSLNLYTYCHNDPVNYVDPSGHDRIAYPNQELPGWVDWNGDHMIDTEEERESFDRNHDGIADWNQGYGSKTDYWDGGIFSNSFDWNAFAKGAMEGNMAVTNWGSLGDRQQSNIESARQAWKGGYITYEQYIDNIKLNGGTLASLPSNVTFDVGAVEIGVSNYSLLSAYQQQNVSSAVQAYNGGLLTPEDLYTNLQMNGAVMRPESVQRTAAAGEGYYGTGFQNFEEFFAYTISNPVEAQGMLYRLNDENKEYLNQIIKDYVNYQEKYLRSHMPGGSDAKLGNPNIYQIIYAAPPGWSSGNNNRNNGTYYHSDRNMYDNYEFTLFDALNWMIQTGGSGNFALQTRVTQDIKEAAEGQRNIVGKFMDAMLFMRAAGVIGRHVKPQLFIGSTEFSGASAKDIYLDIMATEWLKGNEDIIGGIYYGQEDSINIDEMRKVSTFIHSQEGGYREMIWIPYTSDAEDRNIESMVNIYAKETDGTGGPLFDVIIIQPGEFYQDNKSGYVEVVKRAIVEYYINNPNSRTKVGIEMEFDMGVVTGRRMGTNTMDVQKKRGILNTYLKVFDELKGMNIPIGVYSGGPNEQGYNDIRFNRNTHNSGNHIPYWPGIDESAYAYGVYYDHFPDRYVGGNPIYDLNNYLYNGAWNPALTESLWLDPRKK